MLKGIYIRRKNEPRCVYEWDLEAAALNDPPPYIEFASSPHVNPIQYLFE